MAKGKVALGALFGAVAGFVTGVLVAPKSGKETRQDIKDAAVKTKATAVEKAGEAKEFAEQKAKEVKSKAEKVSKEVKAKVGEVTEEVTDKAVELKGRTEQAVEGAKKGFLQKPKSTKK